MVSTIDNERIKNSKVNNCKLYFEDFKQLLKAIWPH